MLSRSRLWGLVLLAGLALGLRLAAVWLLAARHDATAASFEHGEIAQNLLAGRGFTVAFLGTTGPTSQEAPFYPALVAGSCWLFQGDADRAVLAIGILQAVVGTLLTLCVAWLGWSLLPQWRSVGWVAGVLAAIHPVHVYMVTQLQVAIWAAALLTLLPAWTASPLGRHAWSKALVLGLLAGWLLLVEPILSLALPIVAVMFWRRDRDMVVADGWLNGFWALTGRAGRLVVLASTAAVVIAPWLYRNFRVHGEPVFIKSTFGYAFWQGNNPASWGTDKIPKSSVEPLRLAHDGTLADRHRALWEARRETLYIDDVLLKPTGYREFAGLSEPERSRRLGNQAWNFIRREPARYARLCLRRLRYFLLFDETNPKAADPLYRITTVTWLVLSFIGLLVLAPRWRSLWPMAAIFVLVTLFHTLTITSARFRIPIEPLSLVWTAAALAPFIDRLPWLRRSRTVATSAAALPEGKRLDRADALRGPHRPSKQKGATKSAAARAASR